ncbi:MAG: HlyC/CorC family transporter [Candidatus Heimdallarchaeota archaeon]|nr:HlyC/CorC family transporter [Candidatus Heimdallarchaeota archaeon]
MTEIDTGFGTFIWIMVLIFINGLFVAAEFALVKIRPSRIEELIKSGSRSATIIKKQILEIDRVLTSIQMGITFASIALGFIGEPYFAESLIRLVHLINTLPKISITVNETLLHTIALIISYIFVSFLHVVLGENVPKIISIQYAEKTATLLAWPLDKFYKLTKPLLLLFVYSSDGIIKLMGLNSVPETHLEAFTEDELKIVLKNSIFDKGIEEYEYRLIRNILEFNDTAVKNVLTPRLDVRALPITCTAKDLLKLAVETGYSRIPIYTETLDDAEKFIHIKDVLPFLLEEKEFVLKNHLRDVISVYQEKSLYSLLNEMKTTNIQMAIIYDEYGSFDGIVTIEDIIEEIFGEIQDEFDEDIVQEGLQEVNGKYLVGGLVSIGNFNKRVRQKYDVKIESEDSVTLAGYVIELFQSEIPKVGQKISDRHFGFEVVKTNGTRIETIEIIPHSNLPPNSCLL